jgi:general secretion pathway protein A
MYKDFFRLNRYPFELSPDPSFMCSTEKSNAALASIMCAIANRKGFVVMTGDAGTGKTLIVRSLFESWKSQGIAFANIFAPRLPVIDFLISVTSELEIKVTEPTKGNLLRAFYGFLVTQFQKDLTTVLVIDEAHQTPTAVLEEIRMLTNVETDKQKLVQVLLIGQPELDRKLDSFELRQLKQRIAIRCQLECLCEEETRQYIERRLSLAGATVPASTIFPPETVKAIYSCSRGTPRLINIVCDQALVAAYALQLRVVPVEIVKEVASDFRLQSTPSLEESKKVFSMGSQPESSVANKSWQAVPVVSVAAAKPPDSDGFLRQLTVHNETPEESTPPKKGLVIGAAAFVIMCLPIGGIVLRRQLRAVTMAQRVVTTWENFLADRTTPSMQPGMESSAMKSDARSVKSIVPRPRSETSKSTRTQEEDVERRAKIEIGKLSRPVLRTPGLVTSSEPPAVMTTHINELPLGNGLLDSPGPTVPEASSSGNMQAPRLLSSAPTVYPSLARMEKLQGIVVIDTLVDATGKLSDMKVISGPAGLTQAAMDVLLTRKYDPARLNGRPVATRMQVSINFSLH